MSAGFPEPDDPPETAANERPPIAVHQLAAPPPGKRSCDACGDRLPAGAFASVRIGFCYTELCKSCSVELRLQCGDRLPEVVDGPEG